MSPIVPTPVDLLWAHQLKREHSFLLDRLKTLEEAPSIAIENTASTLEQLQLRLDSIDKTIKKSSQDSIVERRTLDIRLHSFSDLNDKCRHLEQRLSTQEESSQNIHNLREKLANIERTRQNETSESARTSFQIQNVEARVKSVEAGRWATESAIANLEDVRKQDAERTLRIVRDLQTVNDTAARDRKTLRALSGSVSDLLKANHNLATKNAELARRLKALEQRPVQVPVVSSPVRPQQPESQVVRLKIPRRVLVAEPNDFVPVAAVRRELPVEMTMAEGVTQVQPPSPPPRTAPQISTTILPQQSIIPTPVPRSVPPPEAPMVRSSRPQQSIIPTPVPRSVPPAPPPEAPMVRSSRPQHAKTFSQATTQDEDPQPPFSPVKSVIKQPPPELQSPVKASTRRSPVKPSTRSAPRKAAKPRAPPNVDILSPSKVDIFVTPNIEIYAPRQTRSQAKALLEQESQVLKASMHPPKHQVPAPMSQSIVRKHEVHAKPKLASGRHAAGKVSGNGAWKAQEEEKAQVQDAESKRKLAHIAAAEEEDDELAHIPAPKRRRMLI